MHQYLLNCNRNPVKWKLGISDIKINDNDRLSLYLRWFAEHDTFKNKLMDDDWLQVPSIVDKTV